MIPTSGTKFTTQIGSKVARHLRGLTYIDIMAWDVRSCRTRNRLQHAGWCTIRNSQGNESDVFVKYLNTSVAYPYKPKKG